LNDSKKPLGSRVDRHEDIGDGQLGLDAFGFLLNDERFRRIPKLLETPKKIEHESDRRNLATLRGLLNSRAHEQTRTAEDRSAHRV
jgi:deoxyribonuclease-4